MKKFIKFGIITILCLISIGFIAVKWIEQNLNQLSVTKVNAINLNQIDDGTYRGSAQVFPIEVEVMVEISEHRIINVTLNKHINGQGADADQILANVVASNSIDVDVISGATYSSKVILQAISNALNGQ